MNFVIVNTPMVKGDPNRFQPGSSDGSTTVYTSAAAACPFVNRKDILKETLHFPAFDQLCYDKGMDSLMPSIRSTYQRYYTHSEEQCRYTPNYTWCFLGEIIWDQPTVGEVIRNGAMVNDRNDKPAISVYFYPETGTFDCEQLQVGHTFCALFAQQHYFMDGSVGLRIEDLNLIKVIPCSLENLFAISSRFSKCLNEKCWACCETPVDEPKKCASCRVACYCNKECQTKDWKECHKTWCKALPEFIKLTNIDYEVVPDYYTFVSKSGERLW